MIECKICGKPFDEQSSLMKHIAVSFGKGDKLHNCPWFAYLAKYEGREDLSKTNLEHMYWQEGKSTPIISKQLGINKVTLIRVMHWYGIKTRSISEATKNQISRDGLWNKGKTKHTHPSIKRYADSRLGENNPFIKAPGYERRRAKSAETFAKYRNRGIGVHCPKSTEKKVQSILSEKGIQFVTQFYLKYRNTWRWFDLLVEGALLIELQGNYYHANPEMYKSHDIIVIARRKCTAGEIWVYDAKKKQLAIDSGYRYLAIWEKDLKIMTDVDVADFIQKEIK